MGETGAPEGAPVWHPKRWRDLPPDPPYGPISRPEVVGKAGPTITFDPHIFPVAPSINGEGEVPAAAHTKWLLWITGVLFFLLMVGFLYFLSNFSKPPADELSVYNETTNPPATIAPSNPQDDGDSGQDDQSGQGGQDGQSGQDKPGQGGGSEPGQGDQSGGESSGGDQGGSEGQGGSGRPGAPSEGVKGKGPGAGSEGSGSGGQGGADQGSQGGDSGSQGGGGQRPRNPLQPDRPQGPPTPGSGSGQATPTTQDPDRLKETSTEDTRVFMQLTLLPLGAEQTGVNVQKPAQGRVEQVNTVKLKNGKSIKVTAFRGTGTRKLIDEHRRSDEFDTEVVYGDVLTRDSNPQLVGRMGADNELIGVLIEGDERIPVADLESIANGMRFDFD